jgi:hypothetical protein
VLANATGKPLLAQVNAVHVRGGDRARAAAVRYASARRRIPARLATYVEAWFLGDITAITAAAIRCETVPLR